jgi:hypothetical protein
MRIFGVRTMATNPCKWVHSIRELNSTEWNFFYHVLLLQWRKTFSFHPETMKSTLHTFLSLNCIWCYRTSDNNVNAVILSSPSNNTINWNQIKLMNMNEVETVWEWNLTSLINFLCGVHALRAEFYLPNDFIVYALATAVVNFSS